MKYVKLVIVLLIVLAGFVENIASQAPPAPACSILLPLADDLESATYGPDLIAYFDGAPNIAVLQKRISAFEFMIDSPVLRKKVDDILKNIEEILDWYAETGVTKAELKAACNNPANSREAFILRLKNASNDGTDGGDFFEVFESKGRTIDVELTNTPENLDDYLNPPNTNSQKVIDAYSARQGAITKAQKIEASETLGMARAEQVMFANGYTPLYNPPSHVRADYSISGPQGEFDQLWIGPSPENKLCCIESKGGVVGNNTLSIFGTRKTANDQIVMQGTIEYRDDIINNMLMQLDPQSDLYNIIQTARNSNPPNIEYVLVKQKFGSAPNEINNFIIKKFD